LRRVVKRARRPESLGERQLHRVRIAFKRLRYLGELVAPVVDPEVTADLDTLAGFQDCLGDLNDATVARRWFRELARVTCASPAPDPDFLLGLGGLVHLQDAKSTKKSGEFLRRWKRFRAEARRLDRRLASRPPAGGAGSA
jgi:CHAD domain-containing protein